MGQLPASMQNQALKYRRWQDRQRYVIGKHLLTEGLHLFNCASYSLHDVRYTNLQRPYIDSEIDFNISHANDFTILAISDTSSVGIDIEKTQNIDFKHFEAHLSESELAQVSQHPDSYSLFYRLWTQKEAFIKAVGIGLNVSLNKITVENNCIMWKGRKWFLHEIKLHDKYVCYLCTSMESPVLVIKEFQFPIANF